MPTVYIDDSVIAQTALGWHSLDQIQRLCADAEHRLAILVTPHLGGGKSQLLAMLWLWRLQNDHQSEHPDAQPLPLPSVCETAELPESPPHESAIEALRLIIALQHLYAARAVIRRQLHRSTFVLTLIVLQWDLFRQHGFHPPRPNQACRCWFGAAGVL